MRFDIHSVIGRGWIHTHGMAEHGYPEVEVRDVPNFLAESAVELVRHVCDYMLDSGVRIEPGETMALSPRTRFRLVAAEPSPGEEGHYDVECLRIEGMDQECDCEFCRPKASELN
jgi:hypothetical protein